MANENFLQTLDEFSGATNKIIVTLNEKLDWIHEHHQRCKVAKTVGTTASVGGAAVIGGALLAAPFTGNELDKINMTKLDLTMILYF